MAPISVAHAPFDHGSVNRWKSGVVTVGTLLTPVAFDIETTGLGADAYVTAVGFGLPLGCRVLIEVGDRAVDIDDLATDLAGRFDTGVNLTGHDGERALLEGLGAVLADSIAPRDYLLVAYNGERWSGGFDLPFLRTRHAVHGLAWPFDDVPYADLMPLLTDRFNTTIAGTECSDLDGAYEVLIGGPLSDEDPFEESERAVRAHEAGEFAALVAHNIADLERTRALGTLAQRYCPRRDFDVKSLTAATRDPALSRPD